MAAVLNIDIHVNDDGSLAIRKVSEEAKKAEQSTKSLSNSTNNLGSSFSSLSSTLKGVGIAAVAYEALKLGKTYVDLADKMTIVESRLKLVTSSIEEQTKAHKELFSIAQQTRLGFKETADLYSRIAISTKDYNISQEKLISITNTINKAMIISGGTAESMNSAIIQLGQAFSGNFQSVGQELASIREQTPALYQAIVKGTGMTSQAFKKAAEDGELSAEIIIKALEKQSNAIDTDFNKMIKTVGQSMTQMSNSMLEFVGYIDKSTGISTALSESITSMSSSIDSFTKQLKNSNIELDALAKKGNIKLEKDGILASILEANQGAGDALYKVLAETLGIVDKTAGEWSKIIDSSYSGMGKWVESVGISLGVVEEKAKATKKVIDSIVPSRPTADKIVLVEDLPDRFDRSTEMTKKQLEDQYDLDKKAYDEKLKLQKKSQEDAIKLSEDWAKRKKEISYEIAEAEQDVLAKPYIELEKKYNEDLEKHGKNKDAKALIDEAYYSKVDALNKKTIEDFNKKEEEKNKKAAEWQVKLFEANEKINDQIIDQREKMYGATSEAQIEAWYQNQLEWLGKLALEGKATSEELQALLDKINGLKELKLKEQTISFKLEKSFYDSFENGLTDSIEDAFNGDSLNLKKFFRNIGNSLTNTIASSMSGSIVNSLRGGTSLLGGLSSLAVGSSVSASEISSIMNSGGTFDSASNTITTSGGSKIDVGESGSGTVKSAGSDVMSLTNTVSSLKTAYGLLSNGLSSSVLGMFQSGASGLSSLGFAGAGSTLGEFGVGFASPWATQAASAAASQAGATAGLYGSGVGQVSGAQIAGGYAGGALIGAGVGYGIGTLGDKLFGAQTKAGTYGAIGGAIGSVIPFIGTISGAAIGSLIGGMFGTKKTKDTGFQFFQGVNSSDNLNTDMIKGYADWQKKSWFSNKKGTNYSNLTSAQLKQIEGLFDTYDYLLKQLGDSDKIWLAAGKYSGESFQAQITKNFITAFTDVNQNIDGTMYQTWVDYATSVNTTVMEAFTTAINSFITEKRGFEVWSLGSTTTEALGKKAQFAKEDLDNLTNSIGIVGVTAENYIEKYNEAIKNNFTPEAIKNWNSLGEAIMASTEAQKAYQESLTTSNKAIDDSIATLANTFLTSYTSAMSEINTVALNLIGTISNLRSQTKSLSDQLNTYSSGGASIDYLISQYNSAKKAFMGNFDAKGTLLAGKDKSMQDAYGYLESIIGQLSGAGINKITRGALVSEVGTFDTLFKNNENALKVEVVSGNLSVTEMAKALNLSEQQITQLKNTNSFSQDQLNTLYSIATTGATDQTLTSINSWLKSLYEVQAEAKIANTAPMSAATFAAGHTLGTQEKIDFAKATGLVIGSEPFSKAITQMQGFATSSNSYSYLSGLLNSGETDIANTIREVGAKAPTSATTALSQINTGASAQWAQYDSLMAKDSALQDKINKANAVFSFWGGANQRRYISQDWYNQYGGWQWNNLGIGTYPNQYYYVAPAAWSKAQALYGQLVAQEQSINPIKPTIPRAGYKTGGYTGDYGVDEVAGVVHGQEYVLNAQTTKDLGINNNNGGVFKEMVAELKSLRQEVLYLKQINANHMRETTNGNNMLKRMSGGGVALSVKAVS